MKYYQLDVTLELNTQFSIIGDETETSQLTQVTSSFEVNVGQVQQPEILLERLRILIQETLNVVKDEETVRRSRQ